MKIKLWGTRGSIATPGPDTSEFGGNTTCVEVVGEDAQLIIDAGTGIRALSEYLVNKGRFVVDVNIFITHAHTDHIQGFPFFTPAYMPASNVHIFGSNARIASSIDEQVGSVQIGAVCSSAMEKLSLEERTLSKSTRRFNKAKEPFAIQQDYDNGLFPVRLKNMAGNISFTDLREREIITKGSIEVCHIASNHPQGVAVYKFVEKSPYGEKVFVFATDYENDGLQHNLGEFGPHDKRLIDFASGADLFFIDGQYTPEEYNPAACGKKGMAKIGWGHSQIEEACRIAYAAGVGSLVITHHDPTHKNEELRKMERHCIGFVRNILQSSMPVEFAREGKEYVL